MLLRLVTCCVLAGLVFPCVCLAWTRAHVREAHARVELTEQGPASVQLELVIDVQGGWLERLELPLLDDELQLAEGTPAQVTLESGEQLMARATLKGSVVTLKFERRDGLRRGLHRVRIHYTTDLLAHATRGENGSVRVGWSLPGWESGLLAADITFAGREPLRAVPDEELAQDVSDAMEGALHTVRFVRVHVPRTSPWRVAVDVPRSAFASRGERPSLGALQPRAWSSGLGAAAFCLAVALFGRAYVRRRLVRQRLTVRSVFGSAIVPWWALGVVAALSGLCWPFWQSAACLGLLLLPVLGLEISAGPLGPLPLGGFQPLQRADLRKLGWGRLREHLGVPFVDITTLLGLGSALALVVALVLDGRAFLVADPWGLPVLSSLLGWVLCSRTRLPRSLAEQLAILTLAARKTRTVGCALGLVWYVAGEARDQPRLRLLPRGRYAGLLRLEVLVDSRRSAGPLLLSVLVEADSPAERWTRGLWPAAIQERSPGGPRLALLIPVQDLSAAIEHLLEHFTRKSQRAFAEPSEQTQAA
jgi:hypothetical protein